MQPIGCSHYYDQNGQFEWPFGSLPFLVDMDTTRLTLQERLDRLVAGYMQDPATPVGEAISYSPAQAYRIFHRRFGEAPGGFRRRVLLEQAAERLVLTDEPVWKVALECGYSSPEPFLRAFRSAYRVTPRRFRQLRSKTSTWLPSPSGLHYWRGTIVSSKSKGENSMNLTDRLIGHDLWLTGQMLERAQTLEEEQLDSPLSKQFQFTFFESADQSLRDILDSLVFNKEIWLAAMYNRPYDFEGRDKTTKGLLTRWKAIEPEFRDLTSQVGSEGRWDDKFVDALCTPPETFSFGGVIAHILTVDAGRRLVALEEMRRLGMKDLRWGCPIEWEREVVGA